MPDTITLDRLHQLYQHGQIPKFLIRTPQMQAKYKAIFEEYPHTLTAPRLKLLKFASDAAWTLAMPPLFFFLYDGLKHGFTYWNMLSGALGVLLFIAYIFTRNIANKHEFKVDDNRRDAEFLGRRLDSLVELTGCTPARLNRMSDASMNRLSDQLITDAAVAVLDFKEKHAADDPLAWEEAGEAYKALMDEVKRRREIFKNAGFVREPHDPAKPLQPYYEMAKARRAKAA